MIEVSKKCSETAAELSSEFSKLHLSSRDGLRRTLGKSFRAIQRRKFITETQEKLEKYQKVLNSRILSKLDCHAIQQSGELENLDQRAKDLVFNLSQGFNTVEQLLAKQTLEVRQYIDRRFNELAHTEALQRAEQQFKDSLFFPEMFARQDDIPKSHEGTCCWIFGRNYPKCESDPGSNSESDSKIKSHAGSDIKIDFEVERSAESTLSQPWFSFTDWLENGEDAYWSVDS